MEKISLENVTSVYSGKPGCCCGCLGKHTYASAHREWSSNKRGYEVKDDEINARVVKLHINRINRAIEDGGEGVEKMEGYNGNWYYFLDTGTRWYIVYLKGD
jgi:hypothetical protein